MPIPADDLECLDIDRLTSETFWEYQREQWRLTVVTKMAAVVITWMPDCLGDEDGKVV
jgi:hypothetical protein